MNTRAAFNCDQGEQGGRLLAQDRKFKNCMVFDEVANFCGLTSNKKLLVAYFNLPLDGNIT